MRLCSSRFRKDFWFEASAGYEQVVADSPQPTTDGRPAGYRQIATREHPHTEGGLWKFRRAFWGESCRNLLRSWREFCPVLPR